MTKIITPTRSQWATLVELGIVGQYGVGIVLLHPDIAHNHYDTLYERQFLQDTADNYDFSDDDVSMEIVDRPDHPFLDVLNEARRVD